MILILGTKGCQWQVDLHSLVWRQISACGFRITLLGQWVEWEGSFAYSTAKDVNSSFLGKEAALAVTAEDSVQEGYDPQHGRRTGWHRSGASGRDVAKDPVSARASLVVNTWQM